MFHKKILMGAALVAASTLFFNFDSNSKDPKTAAELGEKLFFEKALSLDNTQNCASCHIPEFAFADTAALSLGVAGKRGKRNAPSVMNMAARSAFFYDGRAKTLADQVHFPIEDGLEMNVPMSEVVVRLNKRREYVRWFEKIYHQKPTADNISDAIAAYESTLETSNTPFDEYMSETGKGMSKSAIRGRELFMSSRTKCFDCHFSPDFTGDEFRNIGLYDGKKLTDAGRFDITRDSADLGKFKVPGLRNIAVTAPYMHDGSFKTLRQVIDYYDNPMATMAHAINRDTLIRPIGLNEQEKVDLENFLRALTDHRFDKKKN
ncbi:cytochrome c peroxidase [Flexibacter flexilis DSM 6793]|uniref:Cytochrome c peroxidase n=1 Tax=Flexibacter flexilis DSM 6793 TaxID=927664 RepID=A0A1I1DSV6_9BACT|nr:cytochrome c peroxidase [Flexibacter flexilis]SFB77981.1 cytochrome c peroxidase [Flexibacter flexilis DSM 6793]